MEGGLSTSKFDMGGWKKLDGPGSREKARVGSEGGHGRTTWGDGIDKDTAPQAVAIAFRLFWNNVLTYLSKRLTIRRTPPQHSPFLFG